jgi:hypothetical protein
MRSTMCIRGVLENIEELERKNLEREAERNRLAAIARNEEIEWRLKLAMMVKNK